MPNMNHDNHDAIWQCYHPLYFSFPSECPKLPEAIISGLRGKALRQGLGVNLGSHGPVRAMIYAYKTWWFFTSMLVYRSVWDGYIHQFFMIIRWIGDFNHLSVKQRDAFSELAFILKEANTSEGTFCRRPSLETFLIPSRLHVQSHPMGRSAMVPSTSQCCGPKLIKVTQTTSSAKKIHKIRGLGEETAFEPGANATKWCVGQWVDDGLSGSSAVGRMVKAWCKKRWENPWSLKEQTWDLNGFERIFHQANAMGSVVSKQCWGRLRTERYSENDSGSKPTITINYIDSREMFACPKIGVPWESYQSI